MSQSKQKVYKSPISKLLRFFEKSRDKWKAKCKQAKATIKNLKHRIRYLEKSKQEWKDRAKTLEQQLAEIKNTNNAQKSQNTPNTSCREQEVKKNFSDSE